MRFRVGSRSLEKAVDVGLRIRNLVSEAREGQSVWQIRLDPSNGSDALLALAGAFPVNLDKGSFIERARADPDGLERGSQD